MGAFDNSVAPMHAVDLPQTVSLSEASSLLNLIYYMILPMGGERSFLVSLAFGNTRHLLEFFVILTQVFNTFVLMTSIKYSSHDSSFILITGNCHTSKTFHYTLPQTLTTGSSSSHCFSIERKATQNFAADDLHFATW